MKSVASIRGKSKWAMSVARTHSADGNICVATLVGELDACGLATLDRALCELLALGEPVMLDLSRVSFCSIACVEAIAHCRKKAVKKNLELSIRANRRTARYLEMCEPDLKIVAAEDFTSQVAVKWLSKGHALQPV
ncbi:STAS domain-containing protein [Hoyosella rhizosphaerae]|uniref:MlaB-like STAS domain-containing protein n=1 Tax=Hoyosella rhizosphaerae TaxID=1755582 RepID=A0A916U0Y5_9ACTN|nr:STAS domain-containing protein [Hoyosella rhizosphaerae]MBN4926927.1 STAS domain-containing protein [Hoyosella rhizosphaerae]GGC55419.1 hypothetical protein GCM10011410_04760 [Hoyosella rhizosphaerae]